MTKELVDLKKLKAAVAAMDRAESGEEQLKAVCECLDIMRKYDPEYVRRLAQLHTLDVLKSLQEIAAESIDAEVREEAKQTLARYEKFLFPPGTGA